MYVCMCACNSQYTDVNWPVGEAVAMEPYVSVQI